MGIQKSDETAGMKLIITDTNVFFDIISIGALPEFFSLDFEIYIGCPLLTGDRKLRLEAEGHGVEVHGTIWVITSLVEDALIDKVRGIELLETLKEVNSSLPFDEIDNLIRAYKRE